VAALGLGTWIVRAAWLAATATRAVAGLPRLAAPAALVAAAGRSGVSDVVCVAGPVASAFCTGLLRPRVVVTSGMVAALAAEELEAVLVHEAEHARRRDPLRRLAGRAAAEVLVWLPPVGWWTSRRLEEAELAADRAAIDRVGRTPLARALRATAIPTTPAAVGARFDGAGAARVRQLLGEELPPRRPPLVACPAVAAGLDAGGQPGHVRRPGLGQRGRRLNLAAAVLSSPWAVTSTTPSSSTAPTCARACSAWLRPHPGAAAAPWQQG
jgi:hypothetical protein